MAAPLSIRTFPFLTQPFGARNRALAKGRIPFRSKVEDTLVTEGGSFLAMTTVTPTVFRCLEFSGQSAEARET